MSVKNQGPVLIVEDGDEDYEIFRLTLHHFGVENPVYRCTDGDEALDFLRQQGQFAVSGSSVRPSLIVIDLNLPGTDGKELLQQIFADAALCIIPSIVLSTSNNPADINVCYGLGANCYAIKPVGLDKYERLVSLIRDWWLSTVELPS